MDALIYCSRCKMAVQTECTEEDHTTCALFKSAEARKEHNDVLEGIASKELLEHPDMERTIDHANTPTMASWMTKSRKEHNDAIMSTNWPKDAGRKDDTGKTPLDLLAPEFLFGTAEVLKFGAQKYEAYNWAKGMKWSRVFGALMRHMWKWWGGEKLDPETGMSHLWHASCGLMFLIAYEQRGTGDDDRYTG